MANLTFNIDQIIEGRSRLTDKQAMESKSCDRIDQMRWLRLAIAIAIFIGGCASQPKPSPQEPAASTSTNDDLLKQLRKACTRTEREIDDRQQRMVDFRRQHPNFELLRDVSIEKVKQISQAYVAAQLMFIDDQSQFAHEHPKLQSTERRLEELRKFYEQALQQASKMDAVTTEYERLKVELDVSQAFYDKLRDRIREVEMAQVTQQDSQSPR